MITRINGLSAFGTSNDPRKTSRHAHLRNGHGTPRVSYKSNYEEEYKRQQANAIKTSLAILLGSLAFMTGYFMLSGLRNAKKAV